LGDKIKKNEMGGACGMYRGENMYTLDFVGETQGKETTSKT
jgi:hypothetical protein